MFDCAHSMMTCVIKYYYHKGPRTCWQTYYPKEQGYWDGDAVVWGQGGGLSAFVALREASVDTEQEEYYRSLEDDMFKGIQHFWVTDHGRTAYSVYPDSGNDRFYDDNVWIGLDMAKWYAISKDVRYLNQAKAVWDYLSQYGWDNTCGGGVHWKELNEPSKSKHTCSTAPTGVLSCKLYQLTHEQKYLDKAIECFNWLQAYMQDPSDHLYYDNVSPDPEDPTQPGRMETNKYSYNSGQPLQLACLLYKITKNESYLTAAHQIAEACHKKWFSEKADDVYGGRLPVHVRCLIDECANIGQIPKLEKLVATIRSREISACLVLQAQSQLKAIYKDNADTIIGNMDTSIFLGGKEPTTLKELAAVLGKETIDTYNTGESRGRETSHSLNYQKLGKDMPYLFVKSSVALNLS